MGFFCIFIVSPIAVQSRIDNHSGSSRSNGGRKRSLFRGIFICRFRILIISKNVISIDACQGRFHIMQNLCINFGHVQLPVSRRLRTEGMQHVLIRQFISVSIHPDNGSLFITIQPLQVAFQICLKLKTWFCFCLISAICIVVIGSVWICINILKDLNSLTDGTFKHLGWIGSGFLIFIQLFLSRIRQICLNHIGIFTLHFHSVCVQARPGSGFLDMDKVGSTSHGFSGCKSRHPILCENLYVVL